MRLLTYAGHHDHDLVPHFLRHYRDLGVECFSVALHGDWHGRDAELVAPDVEIVARVGGEFTEVNRLQVLNEMLDRCRGEWVVHADLDEFLQLPVPSLRRTVNWLTRFGATQLPATLLQRLAATGELAPVGPDTDLESAFPLHDVGLTEAMGVSSPVWKLKFPVFLADDRAVITAGNHRPPHPAISMHVPMRGVVHHFKWRAALVDSVASARGERANQPEQDAYADWLAQHDGRLPTADARATTTTDLRRRGLLVTPDARSRHQALVRAAAPRRPERIRTHRPAGADAAGRALVDPRNLAEPPGRIALVSFEVEGPDRSGGIGSAVAALAEALVAADHEVHLVYCPHVERWVEPTWTEYWRARGVVFHFRPREAPGRGFLRYGVHASEVADLLHGLDLDVVHLVDRDGAGVVAALRRALGRDLRHARLVTTVHSPPAWRAEAGGPFDDRTREIMRGIALLVRHSDVVVCPSRHMADWLDRRLGPTRGRTIVLPNTLAGLKRTFAEPVDRPASRPVDEVVYFGRLAPTKGLERFTAAIRQMWSDPATAPARVTLLGRDDGIDATTALARFGPVPEGTQLRALTNRDSLDALHLLRAGNRMAVVPSVCDNLPYSVYECLDGGIPVLASTAGGIPELVHPGDRGRLLVANDVDSLAEALRAAVNDGLAPGRLAFDPDDVDLAHLALTAGLVREARRDRDRGRGPTPSRIGPLERLRLRATLVALAPRPAWTRRLRRAQRRIRRPIADRVRRTTRPIRLRHR